MKKNYIWICIFTILTFIYEELIFHLATFKTMDINILYLLGFAISQGLFIYIITGLFKNKNINTILYIFIITLICIFYNAQFIYYSFYKSIISIYSLISGGQVFGFMSSIITVILKNWFIVLMLLLPVITLLICVIIKIVRVDHILIKEKITPALLMILIYLVSVITINYIPSNAIYSNKNLYFNIHAPLLTTDKFGVMTMMRLDLERTIFGFSEKDIEVNENNNPNINDTTPVDDTKEVTYNKLDIDWNNIKENAPNDTIKSIDEYLSNSSISNKNDYTGMFNGKNLIVLVAEAFSPMAIDENLTPTLYKLYKEGFQFDNFYTPLFPVSTADGEYMTDTSLIPKEGVWSVYRVKDNYMPLSYANVFENLGYTSRAYHNNTYTYYRRNDYLKAMGYDSYLACGNGLESKINCKQWPQSDLEMINATVDDYINDDHFLAYYMTVSGHLEYSRNGNMMTTKNWNLVKDLDKSAAAKSYLAANIELDKALASLIEKLGSSGKLADTVISISGDHYPYGLTLDEINELSDYTKDENFEIHHMSWLLWNSTMEEPVKVNKVSSSLDIVPTLYNMFGIDYDSRLFMGRDIMSDVEGLVIFSNRSYITEQSRYNALTKEITGNTDTEYNSNISNTVYNKFKYSRLILENDYYRSLYQRLGY